MIHANGTVYFSHEDRITDEVEIRRNRRDVTISITAAILICIIAYNVLAWISQA